MSSLTKSKIAYDLNISPHKYKKQYKNGEEITFVFSSNLYLKKFSEAAAANREKINASLSNRFGFSTVNNLLCDLKLYITIEKRGFLIYKGQVKIECLNDITLDGSKMIVKN